MAYKYSKFQRVAIIWLSFFSVVCVVNSILVIRFGFWNFDGELLAYMLPIGHLSVMGLATGVYGLLAYATGGYARDPNILYIKKNHPDIWDKVCRRGKFNPHGFAWDRFLRRKYDDGSDERLNNTRRRHRVDRSLMSWLCLLTLGICLFNYILGLGLDH